MTNNTHQPTVPAEGAVISPKVMVTWDSDKLNLVKDWLKEKKSLAWIAQELGVTKNNLKQAMFRYDIRARELRPEAFKRSARSFVPRERELTIPERLAVLRGEQVIKEDAGKNIFFSDDQLRAWIANPIIFFKEMLNVELRLYQQEMLKLLQQNRRVVFCCGRGIGKSYVIAMWVLYCAIIRQKQQILVVSAVEDQAITLLEYLRDWMTQNPALLRSVDEKETVANTIALTNKSKITPLGSLNRSLRGRQNVDLLILDEAAYLPDPDKTWRVILPMLRSGTGQFVVSSTPNIIGDKFHQTYLNLSFARFKISTADTPRFTPEELKQIEQDMSPHEFMTEIMAEFMEGSNNFFSPELIMKCSQRYDFAELPDPNDAHLPIYMGVDVGRVKDATVICLFQEQADKTLKVVYAKEMVGVNFAEQVHAVKMLYERWKPQMVVVENNGLSMPIVEQLRGLGLPITPFQSSVDTKQEAFTYLLSLMQQGKVILPMISRLQFQMRNFMYEVTPSGKLKLHHVTEKIGDDWCDALAFACWATKKRNSLVVFSASTEFFKSTYTHRIA